MKSVDLDDAAPPQEYSRVERLSTAQLVVLCLVVAVGGLLLVGVLRDAPTASPNGDPGPLIAADSVGLIAVRPGGLVDFVEAETGTSTSVWDPESVADRATWADTNDRNIAIVTEGGDVVLIDTMAPRLSAARVWQGSSQGNPKALTAAISGETVVFAVDVGHVFVHDNSAVSGSQRVRVWNASGNQSPARHVALGSQTAVWSLDNGNAFAQDLTVEGSEGLRRIWAAGARTPALELAVSDSQLVGFLLGNGNVRVDDLEPEIADAGWLAQAAGDRAVGIEALGDQLAFVVTDGRVVSFDASEPVGSRGSRLGVGSAVNSDQPGWFDVGDLTMVVGTNAGARQLVLQGGVPGDATAVDGLSDAMQVLVVE